MTARIVAAAAMLMLVTSCATDGGRPGVLTNMFCGMRESACEQRCEAMDAAAQIACRRSCQDSAREKCG